MKQLRRPLALADRYWPFVKKGRCCWLWVGAFDGKYGRITTDEGRRVRVHQVAWFLEHGKWSEGVYRTCREMMCVRPSHLVQCLSKVFTPTEKIVRAIRKKYESGETAKYLEHHYSLGNAIVKHVLRGGYCGGPDVRRPRLYSSPAWKAVLSALEGGCTTVGEVEVVTGLSYWNAAQVLSRAVKVGLAQRVKHGVYSI